MVWFQFYKSIYAWFLLLETQETFYRSKSISSVTSRSSFINQRSLKTTWLLQFSPIHYLKKKSLRKINGLVKIEKGEKLQKDIISPTGQPASQRRRSEGYLSWSFLFAQVRQVFFLQAQVLDMAPKLSPGKNFMCTQYLFTNIMNIQMAIWDYS